MASIRIATTRQRDLQPFAMAGQTVAASWSVMASMLERELSPAHAALFAEPVVNAARGETDWYGETPGPGTVLPLAAADPATRERAVAERARLEADIRGLAERKRAAGREGERLLGQVLELALGVPGAEHVYVLDGRPVLTAWGHATAGAAPEAAALTGRASGALVPMAILPPPAPPSPARRPWRWLAPALAGSLALLALALLLVLRDPFGWTVAEPPACHADPGNLPLLAELRAASDREAELRADLGGLVAGAGQRRLQCAPLPAPAPPQQSQDERLRERGAHAGKVQIVLVWDDTNDLDLHVFCPGNQIIFFHNRNACGGHLDVDANGDARGTTATPVENVYFDQPAPGHYKVAVDPYAMRVGPSSPFHLTIKREGQPDQVVEGVASLGDRRRVVAEFDLGAS